MKQLTMGDILNLVSTLQKEGMSTKEIVSLPVYIGNDDELNGIHCGWYAQPVDPNNEDDADLVELINEDTHKFEIKGKAILIS
jgi:hypothetical protein